MDGTCLVLSNQDDIEAMIPGKKFRFSDTEHYYKTVNLYKFSREFSIIMALLMIVSIFPPAGVTVSAQTDKHTGHIRKQCRAGCIQINSD